jgi:hypothetical protein
MGSRPSESKVVDRGREEFCESDEGFQTYLKKRAKSDMQSGTGVGVGEGRKGGGPTNGAVFILVGERACKASETEVKRKCRRRVLGFRRRFRLHVWCARGCGKKVKVESKKKE